jgi:hypothetical protein
MGTTTTKKTVAKETAKGTKKDVFDIFLTVDEALSRALESLKGNRTRKKTRKKTRGKIYVWKQRFKEGNLSHKKVAGILKKAGFHRVVEEKWMPIDPKALSEQEYFDEEPFKD